ncbi:MAG: hypothetical protein MUF42_15370 [Cytophagaceae bacterium]|jgi:hypothetical protein|nr:hypothetical protein [Cytophagaceae bacterium]
MRNKNDYFLWVHIDSLQENIDTIYRKVFRTDYTEPGFIVIDFGLTFTSEKLRETMVKLKNQLSQLHIERAGQKLLYQWMGRFDQQETTKFHLDNAADQSFLMLGYEPSVIKSKLLFADYSALAKSMNISGEEYFEKYNPMFIDGENLLKPFITEIEGFREDSYKIVLMNNSNSNKPEETIGVFHKAEIIQKDLTKERVINSTMMYSANVEENERFSYEEQQKFITTDKISKR